MIIYISFGNLTDCRCSQCVFLPRVDRDIRPGDRLQFSCRFGFRDWCCNMLACRLSFHTCGPSTVYSSLRSRRYSRAQGGKLEIPPAQKLSILSSAHRAHGSAHTNVFALENQSERELLIMILAGLQCSKRCQFNNCFVFFCHGEQSNSHETLAKAYTVNIMLFPNPVGKIAITSLPSNKCWIDILCSHFKTMGRPIADK